MFVVKLLLNDFSTASRDKREISVLESLGCRICIMYPFDNSDPQFDSKYEMIALPKKRTNINQFSIYRKIIIIIYFLRIAKQVKDVQADCISCHDLEALLIGWMATWGINKKPKLVYDAHEFEIGRDKEGKRGKLLQWIVPRAEKFLMGRCAFSIMVNDSIADVVQKTHHLKERPLIIRNIASYWERDNEACEKVRREFCQALNVPENAFLVMYHGSVAFGRGIETLLEVIEADRNIAAIILGDSEGDFIVSLKARAMDLGISNRVLFCPAVSIHVLKNYVGAVDVGVTLAKNICLNHYYMLPNKLFENIQSETPIIGSDFPEIKKIIEGFQVGLCCDPENVESVVECIEKLRTDRDLYRNIKDNLKVAKEELCWENEKELLEDAYKNLMKELDVNAK